MSSKDDKYNPARANDDDDDESGESGRSGRVEFREFVGNTAGKRDDLLSPEEKKRLLMVHAEMHEAHVEKQKELRDKRQALKEGRIPLQTYLQGLQSNENYDIHPLSHEAQFSGMRDPQTNDVPGAEAQTNNEKRAELKMEFRKNNDHTYKPAPAFNPKPNPF